MLNKAEILLVKTGGNMLSQQENQLIGLIYEAALNTA